MIKRIVTLTMMMIVLLSLTSCLDFLKSEEDDENPLVGNWVIYRYVEKEYEDGILTETVDESYDADWDNYFSAWIVKFTEDMIYFYENDDGTDYYEEEYEYEHKDGKIVEPDGTTPYTIEDGMLIIETEFEEEWGGVSYKYETKEYYKKYEGDIPPASWVNPLETDSYEDDDSYSSATTLTVNADPQAHTLNAGDEDWFTFTATAGQNYLLIVGSYTDLEIWLYDSNVYYLDDDDDNDYDIQLTNFNYPVESVLFWSATTSGTYYFNVEGYDSYDEGYYVVTVQETTMTSPFQKAVTKNDNKEPRSQRHFLKTR